MEEAEALCGRLAIMVNGQFECMGNVQHLKSKYGKGYTIIVKAKNADEINRINEYIKLNIPGAVLTGGNKSFN